MKRGIDNIRKQTMPYAIGNHLLALNMEDNDEPYRYLPEMMADMNKVCDDIEFVQESMDDYMDTIRTASSVTPPWNTVTSTPFTALPIPPA